MPSKSGRGRGTLELRRVFGGRLRIRVASGTRDRRRFAQLDAMLLTLWESGRLDVLEAIRDRRLAPLEVYRYYRSGELHRVPTADLLQPLEATWFAWTTQIPGEAHRRTARRSGALLVEHGPSGATVHDLPSALQRLKIAYASYPRSFNLARAHCQAFVRDTLSRAHPLYEAVQAIAPFKHRRKASIAAPRLDEVATWAGALPAERAAELWSMYLTGMGRKEYWEDGFEVQPGRVLILGQKAFGRMRVVPKVITPVAPDRSVKRWAERVRQALGTSGCTPHNLRRGYAHLCEQAGIPQTRIRRYLGHGRRTVTDLYLDHDVEPYLGQDAEALRNYLAAHGGVPILGGPDGTK